MYAVFRTGGKQYRAAKGDVLRSVEALRRYEELGAENEDSPAFHASMALQDFGAAERVVLGEYFTSLF